MLLKGTIYPEYIEFVNDRDDEFRVYVDDPDNCEIEGSTVYVFRGRYMEEAKVSVKIVDGVVKRASLELVHVDIGDKIELERYRYE